MERSVSLEIRRPRLFDGIGRMLDFAGAFDAYGVSLSPVEDDARAMSADFAMVGQDLYGAINEFQADNKD